MNNSMKTGAVLLLLFLLLGQSCRKQAVDQGCNDPDAVNYDPNADPGGDCQYPTDPWVGTYEVEQEHVYQSDTSVYQERSVYTVAISRVDPFNVEISNLFDCGETDIGMVGLGNSMAVVFNCIGLGIDLRLNNPNSWSFYLHTGGNLYQIWEGQALRK